MGSYCFIKCVDTQTRKRALPFLLRAKFFCHLQTCALGKFAKKSSLTCVLCFLEPSALNYLQVRSGSQEADSSLSYENLERFRIRLAQSGPLAAAVTKLLDMLPAVDLQTQRDVVPHLDNALRQSAGFASRAATCDAVSVLCNSCPNAFKFPGSSNTNPSVRLLRAINYAGEREHGQAAREKMVHALGNLAACTFCCW